MSGKVPTSHGLWMVITFATTLINHGGFLSKNIFYLQVRTCHDWHFCGCTINIDVPVEKDFNRVIVAECFLYFEATDIIGF